MMRFTFLKIPVTIHPSFWFFLLLIISLLGFQIRAEIIIFVVVFALSILIHEYGHGLMALYFGVNPEIHLHAFGGYTSFRGRGVLDKQHFLITLCGPLFTGLLILVSSIFYKNNICPWPYLNYFFYEIYRLNLFLILVNIAPLYPLDGGQLLRHLLRNKFGEKGVKISLHISMACAVVGCLYFFFTDHWFFATLFFFYGLENFESFKEWGFSSHKNKTASELYEMSMHAMENEEMEKAKGILKKLLKVKNNNRVRINAVELLADILNKENKQKQAYNLLLKADPKMLTRGKCLLCKLAYEEKNYTLIEKYSREIYDLDPTFEIALLNSKAFAQLNDPEYAGGWLQTASLFEDAPKDLLQNTLKLEIYNRVRKRKAFKKYIQKI